MKSQWQKCSENTILEMMSIEVPTNLIHPFVFANFRLPRNLKKWVCTIFNSQACGDSKNIKILILELKSANALTKVWLGITFVEIECNLGIIQYKVTLLYINQQILIIEWKYYYFWIPLDLDCWKLHKTIFKVSWKLIEIS